MSPTWYGLLVALALGYAFLNGYRNAAASTVTAVSTGVLRPHEAVAWTAAMQFAAMFVFPMTVAATLAHSVVDPRQIGLAVLWVALVVSVAGCLIAWRLGVGASLMQAFVGALVGATLAYAGPDAVIGSGLALIVVFIVLAPALAFILSGVGMVGVSRLLFRTSPRRIDRRFRSLQRLSTLAYALGAGANDAQKAVGILWLVLWIGKPTDGQDLPGWAVAWPFIAITLGTLAGGWRAVRAMELRVSRIKPVGGVCADSSAALVLAGATLAGIPIATHHTLSGAIAGAGSAERRSSVRWSRLFAMVLAWLITLPGAGLIAALTVLAMRLVA